jgi:hypothetical protein
LGLPPVILRFQLSDQDDFAALAAALLSLFVAAFVSGFVSVLAPDESLLSPLLAVVDVVSLGAGFRLSVTYQPEPLKTMPAGNNTRRTGPPHSGQSVSAGSENRCDRSIRFLQAEHSYS